MPLGFWAQIAVSVAISFVSSILLSATAPKAAKPEPGSLDVPTTDEGEYLAEVFGTILVKRPVIAWYGNRFTVAIRKKGGKK